MRARELMGTYRNLEELMGTHGNLMHENLWELMELTYPKRFHIFE